MSEAEPRWITRAIAESLHARSLERFGGARGLRDAGALELALDRPRNRWVYTRAESVELAAALGFGLAKNHAFVDGNKRTAFGCLGVFLRWDGREFRPEPAQATVIIRDLAAGQVSEDSLARWIGDVLARQRR